MRTRYRSFALLTGGIPKLFVRLNGNRRSTILQIINLPGSGHHARGNLDILVHELTHVYQFERVGGAAFRQLLEAQRR